MREINGWSRRGSGGEGLEVSTSCLTESSGLLTRILGGCRPHGDLGYDRKTLGCLYEPVSGG